LNVPVSFLRYCPVCILLICILSSSGFAQAKTDSVRERGYSHQLSAGISIPTGVFADSHIIGGGIDYTWSNARFGRFDKRFKKALGFSTAIGADYFLGKTDNYNFQYRNYLYSYVYSGLIFNSGRRSSVSLLAGPSLQTYTKVADLGYGVTIRGAYFLKENMALSPALMYMKHKEADALWAAGLRYYFYF
jgi:hypothetical protein